MDFSLRQLRTLRELAALGTVTATAESLGYTPSAISQQLAGLERSVGVTLTERIGRRLQLTDAGRELVRHGSKLIDQAEAARIAVERSQAEPSGQLQVGVFESLVGGIFAPALVQLGTDAPDVEVHSLQTVDSERALHEVQRGNLDAAFCIDYRHSPRPLPSALERRPIATDRYLLVTCEEDDLPDEPVSLRDLKSRDWIASSPALSRERNVPAIGRSAGFDPRIRHYLEDFGAMIQLAAAGFGVALVPSMSLTHTPVGLRAIELATPLERSISIAHRASSAGRPALEALISAALHVTNAPPPSR